MGEPVSGPHGRGWGLRHGRLRIPTVAREAEAPQVAAPDRRAADPPALAEIPISIVTDEQLPEELRERARDVLLRVAGVAPRPVLHARATLRLHADPALERPAVAKASLDVSGRPVRAHVAARRMPEAIDLLEERLRRNLDDFDELARAHRHETGEVPPGEWRHASRPTARPEYFPRPPEEREVIRRKTFALSALTPEQAALEMFLQDLDFHLFTNADTGEENVVYRRPDGTTALMQITPTLGGTPPFAVDPVPAPVMLIDGAAERLNLTGEPFVFFVDAQTRRGNVLYRRYDGHYGLIEPSAS
jgi:hypothetical protein